MAWLAAELRGKGYTPGVIVRGYGGKSSQWPVIVNLDSDPAVVGDEAVLLARLTNGMVVAGPDRVAAARRCVELGATVVVSDDGLQHYRLRRDFEIAVVDGVRRIGNGQLLPAGPLRERSARLETVDAVMINERDGAAFVRPADKEELTFRLTIEGARNLASGEIVAAALLADRFAGRRVHALAGIGHPEAFFASLRARGMDVDPHPLADHAMFTAKDLRFDDAAPVLMTEKDAVKCSVFADEHCWAVQAKVEIDTDDATRLLSGLLGKL